MTNYKYILAIAFSLILGLSSAVAAEHSHSEHQDSACTLCLSQETASIVGPDKRLSIAFTPPILSTLFVTLPTYSAGKSAYLARAPPQIA